jgi:hypothetical protein
LSRVFIIISIVFGLLASASIGSASHGPDLWTQSEAARHLKLATVDAHEVEHSHEDGEVVERMLGHMHGHDPADHSHQTGFVAQADCDFGLRPAKSWNSRAHVMPKQKAGEGILRPPKSVLVA